MSNKSYNAKMPAQNNTFSGSYASTKLKCIYVCVCIILHYIILYYIIFICYMSNTHFPHISKYLVRSCPSCSLCDFGNIVWRKKLGTHIFSNFFLFGRPEV